MDSMSGMGGEAGGGVLNASGVDFSNQTQAMTFLAAILDDSVLQVTGNTHVRYFWYGIVAFIGVASIAHWTWKVTREMRYGS